MMQSLCQIVNLLIISITIADYCPIPNRPLSASVLAEDRSE